MSNKENSDVSLGDLLTMVNDHKLTLSSFVWGDALVELIRVEYRHKFGSQTTFVDFYDWLRVKENDVVQRLMEYEYKPQWHRFYNPNPDEISARGKSRETKGLVLLAIIMVFTTIHITIMSLRITGNTPALSDESILTVLFSYIEDLIRVLMPL